MLRSISTEKAPAAIGPYSQAICLGNMVFTSGQLPIDPVTGEMVSGIKEQTKMAIENLQAILNAAGTCLDKVVKTTVYIKNMDDFSQINKVYSEYFSAPYPARSCVEAARLPKDADIEIEAIAEISRD